MYITVNKIENTYLLTYLLTLYWKNPESSRSENNRNYDSYLRYVSPWQRKLPAIRHFRPPSYQTPKSTKRCCPAHNQNEETRPHHRCFNRSSLASYQTADRVQIVTVDVSKPSWTSCIIHNRPTNSLRTDPCATLRGRSPTGGSTMQTTYAGRQGIFECCSTPLEQSAACHACHRLPQIFQEVTEDISV